MPRRNLAVGATQRHGGGDDRMTQITINIPQKLVDRQAVLGYCWTAIVAEGLDEVEAFHEMMNEPITEEEQRIIEESLREFCATRQHGGDDGH